MALTFKKAERKQVRIKIGLAGPSGSGKTMGSLLMAYGIVKAEFPNISDEDAWAKIVLIDTENGSGSLYVGSSVGPTTIGQYNTIDLTPPFEPQVFTDAIHMAEEHDADVIIIDSLSHAWAGQGGALDQQGAIAARSGNSWTAWRSVTPQHNKLVDAMLQSPCHVIANMRAKMEYQQTTNEAGKKQVKAIGMGVVMREGIEYEFTTAFMLDYEHIANATKDRTGLFDGKYFMIDANTGRAMYNWLSSGKPVANESNVPAPKKAEQPTASDSADDEQMKKAIDMCDEVIKAKLKDASDDERDAIKAKIKSICGVVNYKTCKDINVLRKLYSEFKE